MITLVASDDGLCMVSHDRPLTELREILKGHTLTKDVNHLAPYAKQIREFLAGTRREFSLKLDVLKGTDMQRKVWAQLQRIPYGQTISYTEMAKRVGASKAVRAAGSACGANPMPLVIPCHRVLAKDGTLGGFGWGLPVKRQLLEMEAGITRKAA